MVFGAGVGVVLGGDSDVVVTARRVGSGTILRTGTDAAGVDARAGAGVAVAVTRAVALRAGFVLRCATFSAGVGDTGARRPSGEAGTAGTAGVAGVTARPRARRPAPALVADWRLSAHAPAKTTAHNTSTAAAAVRVSGARLGAARSS